MLRTPISGPQTVDTGGPDQKNRNPTTAHTERQKQNWTRFSFLCLVHLPVAEFPFDSIVDETDRQRLDSIEFRLLGRFRGRRALVEALWWATSRLPSRLPSRLRRESTPPAAQGESAGPVKPSVVLAVVAISPTRQSTGKSTRTRHH